MNEQIYENPNNLIFIQSRAETNHLLIAEYAEMMKDGIQFDAVQGVRDTNSQIYVWDGLHRGEAAKLTDVMLLIEVQPGPKQHAEWLALSANQKHGLRRTQADKQQIIRKALLHPYGMNLSNREIARHCGVSDKTVGRIRREMEASAEVPQIDERIIRRGGVTYRQDTTNIGSSQPTYVPIWKLETAIYQWLSDTFGNEATHIQVLEAIKHKTSAGQQYLDQLLTSTLLPSPKRKSDVSQACHNLLSQLCQKPRPTDTSWGIVDPSCCLPPVGINECEEEHRPLASEQIEQKPRFQDFCCPRCGQERIIGVNGSRRWCLNCGAEWPKATAFLAEVKVNSDQTNILVREHLQSRFKQLLANLPDGRLDEIRSWLDDLEQELTVSAENPELTPSTNFIALMASTPLCETISA